jgi:hypothetical protein
MPASSLSIGGDLARLGEGVQNKQLEFLCALDSKGMKLIMSSICRAHDVHRFVTLLLRRICSPSLLLDSSTLLESPPSCQWGIEKIWEDMAQ